MVYDCSMQSTMHSLHHLKIVWQLLDSMYYWYITESRFIIEKLGHINGCVIVWQRNWQDIRFQQCHRLCASLPVLPHGKRHQATGLSICVSSSCAFWPFLTLLQTCHCSYSASPWSAAVPAPDICDCFLAICCSCQNCIFGSKFSLILTVPVKSVQPMRL